MLPAPLRHQPRGAGFYPHTSLAVRQAHLSIGPFWRVKVTIQIIEQGYRNLVIKVYDSASTLDVTTLIPPCEELRLMEVQYNIPPADTASINWDGTPDVPAFILSGHEGDHCFESFGGIPNNATSKTGNVIIDPAGGTVVATFRKVRVPFNWEPGNLPPALYIETEDSEPLLTEDAQPLLQES